MPSQHADFFTHERYAVVGHSAEKPFPVLTYQGLKRAGKRVYPVDPSAEAIEGDACFADLAELPTAVDAVVLEVPAAETAAWVGRAADAAVPRVWIHQGRDTEEALSLADERGLEVHRGTCAVMYLSSGFNAHTLHGLVQKALGRY